MTRKTQRSEVWINKELFTRVKTLAAVTNKPVKTLTAELIEDFFVWVEADRPLLILPDTSNETRDDQTMIVLKPSHMEAMRALRDKYDGDAPIRALVTMALNKMLPAAEERAGDDDKATGRYQKRDTRVIHHDKRIVSALKAISAQRGIPIYQIADAVLQVVVNDPSVLDSIELWPSEEPDGITPEQRAAAELAVERAGGPVSQRVSRVPRPNRESVEDYAKKDT